MEWIRTPHQFLLGQNKAILVKAILYFLWFKGTKQRWCCFKVIEQKDGEESTPVKLLDPNSLIWTKLAEMPIVMNHFHAVGYKSRTYILDAFSEVGGAIPVFVFRKTTDLLHGPNKIIMLILKYSFWNEKWGGRNS